jgi:hypothetical protein
MEIKDADLKNKFANRHNPFNSKDIVFSYSNINITQRISTSIAVRSQFFQHLEMMFHLYLVYSFLIQYKR